MTATAAPGVARPPAARAHVTVADLLRSEWTKLRSLRSTWITLGVTVALGVGLSVLIDFGARGHLSPTDDPTDVSLAGFAIAQLALGVLGVLCITGEFATGTIRVSLLAVPRRGRLLAAKFSVLGGICLVVGEVMAFAAFLIGQSILRGHGPSAALSYPGVLRSVIGSGLYLTLIAVTGAAIGTLVKSTAGAITIIVALLFVLPGVVNLLPGNLGNDIDKWWPTEAGADIFRVVHQSQTLSPWEGFGVFVVFALILLVAGAFVADRRNA